MFPGLKNLNKIPHEEELIISIMQAEVGAIIHKHKNHKSSGAGHRGLEV